MPAAACGAAVHPPNLYVSLSVCLLVPLLMLLRMRLALPRLLVRPCVGAFVNVRVFVYWVPVMLYARVYGEQNDAVEAIVRSSSRGIAGLPTAVQCVALPWQEEKCLRVMRELHTRS